MKQLEQMLVSAPKTEYKVEPTIDLYIAGTTALYTAPLLNNSFNTFERQTTLDDYGIGQIGGSFSPYGVLHKDPLGYTERFRQPEFDLRNGHHMNYEIIVPGISKPLSNTHIEL